MIAVNDEINTRQADQNDLKSPEAQVRDRRKLVKTDVFTTWLQGVALELGLLVGVDAVADGRDDDDPGDGDEGDPELADQGRVLAGLVQPSFEKVPRHRGKGASSLFPPPAPV